MLVIILHLPIKSFLAAGLTAVFVFALRLLVPRFGWRVPRAWRTTDKRWISGLMSVIINDIGDHFRIGTIVLYSTGNDSQVCSPYSAHKHRVYEKVVDT